MPCTRRPTRYAHFEGHTDVCYSDDGKYILTCGCDSEVRAFKGLDDDDCTTHEVNEPAYAIASKGGQFLVGLETNIIQAYTLKNGHPDGLITRFSAPTTHITTSKDGKTIAAASSDMTIKVHDVSSFKDKILNGHSAPVLSVAIDPKGEYLASSSCDGCIKIWNIEHSLEIKSMNLLPKSNSFRLSPTLCRLTWSKNGSQLFVPVENEVKIFNRSNWQESGKYFSPFHIKETISIAALSPCGGVLATSCTDGVIVFWDIKTKQVIADTKHAKGLNICGLVWNPMKSDEVAYVDVDGQLGTVTEIKPEPSEIIETPSSEVVESDVFPPPDIDVPMDAEPLGLDEDSNDGEISIAKIKSNLGFADDEDGTFLGLPQDQNKDTESKIEGPTPEPVVQKEPEFKLPELQNPFQPGMTPESFENRYMMWNNVGIVQQYQGDDNSIEVEFHDTSVHHSLHQSNPLNHSMAALSTQVLALACDAQDDQPSKLQVYHFGSWDGSKEWFIDMPEGEEILALCTGNNWIAVATNKRNLRVFSNSGIQRDLLSISGPIVCLSGFEDCIFILYHSGICEGQQISCKIFNLKGKKHPIPVSTEVDLSPHSFLAWAGFSDEGTPAIMDSAGIVRIINPKYGYTWSPILNTRNHTKGKNDHYFVIGINEKQGAVRCIMCKGSRFPPILPRPHVTMLSIKIPLCELNTEKTDFEERIMSLGILEATFSRLLDSGFDVEEAKEENAKLLREKFIKLFALCCQSERENRGYELCELMPSQRLVQMAIKYAGKGRKIQLAEKLGEVAASKAAEEEEKLLANKSLYEPDFGTLESAAKPPKPDEEESEDSDEESNSQDSQKNKESQLKPSKNPLLQARLRRSNSLKMPISPVSQSDRNPFKKSSTPQDENKRGIETIENYQMSKNKTIESSSTILKPAKKSVTKQPSLNFNSQTTKKLEGKENLSHNSETKPVKQTKKSALHLWFEDNINVVKEKFPDTPEGILISKAALIFKDVEDAVKQKYKSMALSQTDNNSQSDIDVKKRKRDGEENIDNSDQQDKKAKSSGISKLAAFAFSGDS